MARPHLMDTDEAGSPEKNDQDLGFDHINSSKFGKLMEILLIIILCHNYNDLFNLQDLIL